MWQSVERKLSDLKISGKHLPHFGPNTICFIGIEDAHLSNSLLSAIRSLVQRYSSEFDKLWKDIEGKWEKWTSEDLTEWLKYQSLYFETGVIDWGKTCELLQFQNMDGKMVPHINAIVLPLLGITDADTIDHLVSSISNLLKRSKRSAAQSVQIPNEFLCPISKQVMKDPVIACDGHTYERCQIEEYLKKHNISPVTKKVMEHSFVFPNEVMKKQITAFLSENGEYLMGNEGQQKETGYINR